MSFANKIAQRFSRAHHQYRKAATVQLSMSDKLITLLSASDTRRRFSRVLEIGCGAGVLTDAFLAQYSADTLFLNDLYQAALNADERSLTDKKPANTQYLLGDISTLSLPDELDLVLSGAALQWIYPLDGLLAKLHSAMRDGGVIAFSSFGVDNLHEMRRLTGKGLSYYTLAELVAVVEAAGFRVVHASEDKSVLHFSDALAVLRHLKDTGVTGLTADASDSFIWNKARLLDFASAYQALSDANDKLPLTYHPLYVIAVK